jgi:circadian clock protein KaiC
LRAFHYGLEMHLARIIKFIAEFSPVEVIVDPISGLDTSGTPLEVKAALMRLVDYLKQKGITTLLTDLKVNGREDLNTEIFSMVDTWLELRDIESNGERNRGLHVLKSRGMSHSNQVREFVLSDTGIKLTDVYIGPSGMLTGSARVAQEARERADHVTLNEEAERQQLALECKRAVLEGQIATLRAEFSAEEATIARIFVKDRQREASVAQDKVTMGRSRQHDVTQSNGTRSRELQGKRLS